MTSPKLARQTLRMRCRQAQYDRTARWVMQCHLMTRQALRQAQRLIEQHKHQTGVGEEE